MFAVAYLPADLINVLAWSALILSCLAHFHTGSLGDGCVEAQALDKHAAGNIRSLGAQGPPQGHDQLIRTQWEKAQLDKLARGGH